MEKFYEEHLHTDPETRMIVEGVGYFDIRSPESDKWIRVELEAGDMISIPAGIYHRFTPSASVSDLDTFSILFDLINLKKFVYL